MFLTRKLPPLTQKPAEREFTIVLMHEYAVIDLSPLSLESIKLLDQ